TARQVRYTNRAFWRNPQAAFFTFAFPLMFLVIFTSLLGGGTVILHGLPFNQSTYYVAGMSAFAIVTACYTNLAISVTFQRDAGILKRTRGTPLPGYDYLAARVAHAILMAVILVAICSAFGATFYHATIPGGIALLESLGAYYGKPFFDFSWSDVVVVALWGIGGLLFAARRFSWEPRH